MDNVILIVVYACVPNDLESDQTTDGDIQEPNSIDGIQYQYQSIEELPNISPTFSILLCGLLGCIVGLICKWCTKAHYIPNEPNNNRNSMELIERTSMFEII